MFARQFALNQQMIPYLSVLGNSNVIFDLEV